MCGERRSSRSLDVLLSGSSPRVRGTRRWPACRRRRCRFIPACAGNASRCPRCSPARSVHPRVCGERLDGCLRLRDGGGSSPRVRGTRRGPHREPRRSRFIPACAGNAWAASARGAVFPVHPRVCGERRDARELTCNWRGSSPRVRGTPRRLAADHPAGRFIPACAGNGWRARRNTSCRAVHPRVCGERACSSSAWALSGGSSPRVRGTRYGAVADIGQRRFIPACAGNAIDQAREHVRIAVHPRVCGERWRKGSSNRLNVGSSPRVRGTLRHEGRRHIGDRFIPACAGNAARRARRSHSSAVHPRVCGERPIALAAAATSAGSSPRVRGTRTPRPAVPAPGRFIPACAGNAVRSKLALADCSVHPRVCGERAQQKVAALGVDGSSPRVRGTPVSQRADEAVRRFIPACAGNASWPDGPRHGSAVHPRVCGERPTSVQSSVASCGSSPRVRGTQLST